MDWFEKLFGFVENGKIVQEQFTLEGSQLHSLCNDRIFEVGTLEVPTLKELRVLANPYLQLDKVSTVRQVVGNVQEFHQDPQNQQALFQVASQCNLLEMVSPRVGPEAGISGYIYDRTQGPACALAAAAGTLYRNYFVPIGDQIGQSRDRQIDTLIDLHAAFKSKEALWNMVNGYALATASGLKYVTKVVDGTKFAPQEREDLLGQVRIGVHWNTEVTIRDISSPPLLVSQAYCSAMPVAYSDRSMTEWNSLGRLVLDAAYEATILAGVLNFLRNGSNKVFLTLLGGGAFGNDSEWILAAMYRAIAKAKWVGLDIIIVSYGRKNTQVERLIQRYNASLT